MADRTIQELDAVHIEDLPALPNLYDDDLLVVGQQGTAKKMTGAQWKAYATAAVDQQVKQADAAQAAAEAAQKAAEDARDKAKGSEEAAEKSATKAEEYSGKPPIIDGDAQTWWTWNADSKTYEDTTKPSRGNLMYACFEVDPTTGELWMFTDDEYAGPQFALNGANLEVILEHA